MVLPILLFMARHVLTRRTPLGRKRWTRSGSTAGHCSASSGTTSPTAVSSASRPALTGVIDGRAQLADGTVLDVTNVVWCTGFKQVFDWIGYRFR